MITCAVLLASGQSSRFGVEDKLRASLSGKPLILHAAAALRGIEADHRIVVTQSEAVAELLLDYTQVSPMEKNPQQSDSLRAGIEAALRLHADRVVVALGDMPFVSASLIKAVQETARNDCAAAASDGRRILPPACFPRAQFAELLSLTGDRGAGALLRHLPQSALVMADASSLIDIDTTEELEAAEARCREQKSSSARGASKDL